MPMGSVDDTTTVDAQHRYCAFCGLPVPKTIEVGDQKSAFEVEYCCSGCRTVASVEEAEGERGASAHGMLRMGLAVFFHDERDGFYDGPVEPRYLSGSVFYEPAGGDIAKRVSLGQPRFFGTRALAAGGADS